jgi:hypothetical protein
MCDSTWTGRLKCHLSDALCCTALAKVIQSKTASTGERLEACKLLLKVLASGTRGKPRGRAFAKKVDGEVRDQRERIERLISGSELIGSRASQS